MLSPKNSLGLQKPLPLETPAFATVGVQTTEYSTSEIYKVENTNPKHFTHTHITKLEDAFSRKQKPDDIQLHILAMECNLSYADVKVILPTLMSFFKRLFCITLLKT